MNKRQKINLSTVLVAVVGLGLTGLVLWMLPQASAQAQSEPVCASDVLVESGDTLSIIAGRTLGNLASYNLIISATNAKAADDPSYATIDNPNLLTVGWKLCIPDDGFSPAPLVPQATPTAIPTLIVAPTPPTLTLAVDEMNPLMIEYMRQQSYPGSDIVIEETLAPGVNYNRYIASYQSEGNKILALLTVPTGAKPATGWPVIIFNHGYIAPEIYRTTERYIAYTDAFSRNGYIVFKSDYRGHGFSEGDASGGYGTPAYTVDVLNAVSSMKRYADADPERMGMWGHSMGGQITLRAMVVTDDIKAGVIWAGVVGTYPDLLDRWRRSSGSQPPVISTQARRWRDELVEEYGSPETNPTFWAAISPNSYVAELSGPIELHHGTLDTSVPLEFSRILYQQIQAVEGAAALYEYPGDDHNIAVNLGTALARSVAFFDDNVK